MNRWWLIPLGVASVVVASVGLMLVGMHYRVVSGPQIQEAYRVLATEGAESPKLASWFTESALKRQKEYEKDFGRPTAMYPPPGVRFVLVGWPFEEMLVMRNGVWMEEPVSLASTQPNRISTAAPRPAKLDMVAKFAASGADAIPLSSK